MTPSPAPDRLTALIDEVAQKARAEIAAKEALDAVDGDEDSPEYGAYRTAAHEFKMAAKPEVVVTLCDSLAALRAEAASVQTDAERYRAIRSKLYFDSETAWQDKIRIRHYVAMELLDIPLYFRGDIDAAIDAARATTPEGNHAE